MIKKLMRKIEKLPIDDIEKLGYVFMISIFATVLIVLVATLGD